MSEIIFKVKNLTGQNQEIHYTDKTEIIKNGEEHTIRINKIQKPELERVKRIFHYQEPDEATKPKKGKATKPKKGKATKPKKEDSVNPEVNTNTDADIENDSADILENKDKEGE